MRQKYFNDKKLQITVLLFICTGTEDTSQPQELTMPILLASIVFIVAVLIVVIVAVLVVCWCRCRGGKRVSALLGD